MRSNVSLLPESDDDRFRRVAMIFEVASFLRVLGIRLEAVGPGTCDTAIDISEAHRQQHGYWWRTVHRPRLDPVRGGTAGRPVIEPRMSTS
jgi:hypothetical protein